MASARSGRDTSADARRARDRSMFTHCLSCRVELPEAPRLRTGVRGARVAYDPAKGRLWSICGVCRSWSLAPLDSRWESVEELERITSRDPRHPLRPRLLSSTDEVALFDYEGLAIVRVGGSNRLEEAWWRYGKELQRRAGAARVTAARALAVGAAIVGGVLTTALPARYAFRSNDEVRRWLRFGKHAWTGRARCAVCAHPFTELTYFDRTLLFLVPQDDGRAGPGLSRHCPKCRDVREGGLHLTGLAAEHTLRRVLAYEHFAGAPENDVRGALRLIEREGSPADLVRILLQHAKQLGDVPSVALTALEVAANEARERRLLGLEVAELERYWREAEELASIVDGELTWVSGMDRLRVRAVGGQA